MKEVHLYDSNTGEYVKTYPSQSLLERENGLRMGTLNEFFSGKIKKIRVVVSREKLDIHPDFINGKPHPVLVQHPNEKQPVQVITTSLSEDELRKKHDMVFMIHSFVRNIPEGRFVEEPVMLRQLGLLGKPRYKDALSRAELKDYKGKVDGVVYYGSSSSIRKLKQEGVLQ